MTHMQLDAYILCRPGAEGILEAHGCVANHVRLLVFHTEAKLARLFKAVPTEPQWLLLTFYMLQCSVQVSTNNVTKVTNQPKQLLQVS